MKKTFLFLLLFTSFFSVAQSYSVLNNAAGEFLLFTPIYDCGELFGYVEVRKMNVDENLNNTFKYSVLDKNLNNICTGELIEKASELKRLKKITDVNYEGGYLIFDFLEFTKTLGAEFIYTKTYQVVVLNKNTIVKKGAYFTSLYYYLSDFSTTYSLDKVGFLIKNRNYYEYNYKGNIKPLCAYDTKGEKIWEYENPRKYKKAHIYYDLKSYNENYIVLYNYLVRGNRNEVIQGSVVVLDSKTGKELLHLPLDSKYTIDCEYAYAKGDQLYIGGKFFEKNKEEYPHFKESLGIYQKKIDLKNNTLIRDTYLKNESFKDLKISKTGRVSGEGFLKYQKCNLNPDGSFFVLAESFRVAQNGFRYTQLYTFLMDQEFNSISATEYDVKSTLGYKYDFSQQLPDNLGKAYFFFDKNDDRDLELNILSYYYKSKKQVVQKMALINDDSTINIFPAKTGYVGIAEYFKNPEKSGKYLEIRLEKINYERE